jgi:sulfur carrier protein
MKITIHVNGQPRQVESGTTIADVLAGLDAKPALLAVERNRSIVPKAEHGTTELHDGDRVEIVTFVGGG